MWVPVPAGYVPFTGSSGVNHLQWTIPGTEITVARMRAERERMSTEGLGSLAQVMWNGTTFKGGVMAWGATSRAALIRLIAGLRELWPDVQAAVASVVDDEWAPGQQRISETGVSITAPAAAAEFGDDALRLTRSLLAVSVGVVTAGWTGALREAVAVSPLRLVVRFEETYTAAGSPDACAMPVVGSDEGFALVAPAARFREDMYTAWAARGR